MRRVAASPPNSSQVGERYTVFHLAIIQLKYRALKFTRERTQSYNFDATPSVASNQRYCLFEIDKHTHTDAHVRAQIQANTQAELRVSSKQAHVINKVAAAVWCAAPVRPEYITVPCFADR